MTLQTYLVINLDTNKVDAQVEWDGKSDSWQAPNNHKAIPLASTTAIDWVLQDKDWVLGEVVGAGKVDFFWDEATQKLTTNRPPPPPKVD